MRHSVNAAVAALFLCAACRDATPASYPRVPTPNPVRGLYVNRWATLDPRIWALIGVAERTEVNALVVDVKDDRGLVLYRSQVPLAHAIGADTTTPLPAAPSRPAPAGMPGIPGLPRGLAAIWIRMAVRRRSSPRSTSKSRHSCASTADPGGYPR